MRERLEGVGALPPLAVIASVVGIGAFALGQPLLDLVGRNPEFFIARRFPSLDIALLAAALMGAPLLLTVPVLLLRPLHRAAAGAAHVALLGVLSAVAAATMLQAVGVGAWVWPLFIGLAVAVGTTVAVLYAGSALVRTAVSFLGLAPLIFAIWFATATPVSGLLFSGRSDLPEAVDVANPAPVVIMVYDEFPLASLMRGDGSLNSRSFPSFARLAADGAWYRNAVGVHQQTEEAVPAILTGREVSEGSIPSTVDHPFTLFSLLSREYDVQAVENVTELCPPFICGNVSRPAEPPARRWTSVTVDLAVVYGHMVLPEDLSADLPPIDQGWGGFGQTAAEDFDIIDRFLDEVSEDRRRELDRFLATLADTGGAPVLRFGHFLYPHHPWELTADGRPHGADRPPGRDGVGWGDDEFLVAQGWQRHLIQARWADTMLGRVLDRLEEEGLYQEALVVVVADHGITIRPGTEHQRIVSDETYGSVAFVPLFVKYPRSFDAAPAPGTVDDNRAETVDILPTVADVVEVSVPWRTDGVSLLDVARRAERSVTVVHGTNGPVEVPAAPDALMEVVTAQEGLFPGGDPYRLTPPGWQDLLGRGGIEGVEQQDVDITVDQTELLAEYDPGEEPVPAFLSGQLDVAGGGTGQEILAVTVGDRVAAVTRAHRSGGIRWEVMVDPAILDTGGAVEVWLVRGSASNPSFSR